MGYIYMVCANSMYKEVFSGCHCVEMASQNTSNAHCLALFHAHMQVRARALSKCEHVLWCLAQQVWESWRRNEN